MRPFAVTPASPSESRCAVSRTPGSKPTRIFVRAVDDCCAEDAGVARRTAAASASKIAAGPAKRGPIERP